MIVDADTVVDPEAVVVIAVDALVASMAVKRLLRPQDLATRADVGWLKIFVQLEEADILRPMMIPWILTRDPDERYRL